MMRPNAPETTVLTKTHIKQRHQRAHHALASHPRLFRPWFWSSIRLRLGRL